MIVETVCEWILDPTNSIKASSKRSILGTIYAILVARGIVLNISPETERRRKGLYNVLVKQEEKDRARGLSKGWIALSDLDYRHMFNRILEQYGSLPVEKLQILFLLLLGKLVGRRSGELIWIAAASWQIKFHRVVDRWVPQLTFQYCFQKISGPASFMESDVDSGEVPPVALALLVLEKKNIIPSAIEAYTNVNGKLDIDTSAHETSDDLSKLLPVERNKLRDANLRGIVRNVDDDDDDTMFEDMLHDLMKQVKKSQSPTKKNPMWNTFVNGAPTSIRFDPQASTVLNFGKSCYYTPKPDLRFGGTCARKGFRQDSSNVISANLNHESHVLQSMGHNQAVSNKHYANQDAYNQEMPQNILQNNMNAEAVIAVIEKKSVPPAFDNHDFFDQSKTPLTQAILPPLEFLQLYSKSREESLVSLPKFVCCGSTCSETFLFEGDWRLHMSSCDSSSWKCAWCGKATGCKTYSSLSSHMSQKCRQKPAHFVRQKVKEEDKPFLCDCGKRFSQKKYLARHQKEHCVNKKNQKSSSNSSSGKASTSKSSNTFSSKKRKDATGKSAHAKSSSKKRNTKDATATADSPASNHLLSDIPAVAAILDEKVRCVSGYVVQTIKCVLIWRSLSVFGLSNGFVLIRTAIEPPNYYKLFSWFWRVSCCLALDKTSLTLYCLYGVLKLFSSLRPSHSTWLTKLEAPC